MVMRLFRSAAVSLGLALQPQRAADDLRSLARQGGDARAGRAHQDGGAGDAARGAVLWLVAVWRGPPLHEWVVSRRHVDVSAAS
jgi:hypothetical protein